MCTCIIQHLSRPGPHSVAKARHAHSSLPPDNKTQREEVLHSLQKMLGLMQSACAKCVTCIFQLISTLACAKLLFAFRPVSRGLSYIMGFSSSCNGRFHVLLITLHFH